MRRRQFDRLTGRGPGGRSGYAVQPIPAAVAGQTLVWQEDFRSSLSSGSPGNFSSVSGSILGNHPNGPTFTGTNGLRTTCSGAVRMLSDAELAAGTVPFNGTPPIFTDLGITRGIWRAELWFRPGSQGYANAQLMQCLPFEGTIRLANLDEGHVTVELSGGPTSVSTTLLRNEWHRIAWCGDCRVGQGRTWQYQVIKSDGTVFVLADFHDATEAQPSGISLLNSSIGAFSAPFDGLLGLARIFSCSSYAVALTPSTNQIAPTNAPIVWNVTDWADLVAKMNSSQISGRWQNIRQNGVLRDTETFTRSDWNKYKSGGTVFTGDTVRLPTNAVFRVTAEKIYRNAMFGITLDTNGAQIYLTKSMASSWSQPDAGGAPKVWQYGGSAEVKRHVWRKDSDTLWLDTIDASAANFTAAKPLLQAKEWSCYTNASGTTYIGLPSSVDPNDYDWEGSYGLTGNGPYESQHVINWSGGLITGGGTFRGGLWVDHSQTGGANRVVANHFVMQAGTQATGIIRDVDFLNGGKHHFGSGGTISNGGCGRWNVGYGLAPCRVAGASNEYGISYTDYSEDVDSNDEATTAMAPGAGFVMHDDPRVYLAAISVEGTGTGVAKTSMEHSYLFHGNGTATKLYAYMGYRNPLDYWFEMNVDPPIPNDLAVVMEIERDA